LFFPLKRKEFEEEPIGLENIMGDIEYIMGDKEKNENKDDGTTVIIEVNEETSEDTNEETNERLRKLKLMKKLIKKLLQKKVSTSMQIYYENYVVVHKIVAAMAIIFSTASCWILWINEEYMLWNVVFSICVVLVGTIHLLTMKRSKFDCTTLSFFSELFLFGICLFFLTFAWYAIDEQLILVYNDSMIVLLKSCDFCKLSPYFSNPDECLFKADNFTLQICN